MFKKIQALFFCILLLVTLGSSTLDAQDLRKTGGRDKIIYVTSAQFRDGQGDSYRMEPIMSFADALAYLGTDTGTIVIETRVYIAADLVIPSNANIKFNQGGIFNIADGKTVTINKADIGLYQVFEGDGTVSFGAGAVKEVHPQWWGENTTPGTTDMTAEIQAAIDSISSGKVLLPSGTINFTNLDMKNWVYLSGAGVDSTILNCTANGGTYALNAVGTAENKIVTSIRHLTILGSSATNVSAIGFSYNLRSLNLLDDVKINYFPLHGICLAGNNWIVNFNNVVVSSCDGSGLYIPSDVSSLNNINFYGCNFESNVQDGTTSNVHIESGFGINFYGGCIENSATGSTTDSEIYLNNCYSLFEGIHIEHDNVSIGIYIDSDVGETVISRCSLATGYSISYSIKSLSTKSVSRNNYMTASYMFRLENNARHLSEDFIRVASHKVVSSDGTGFLCSAHRYSRYPATGYLGKWETSDNEAPTTGAWGIGDICWNAIPTAGGAPGWICVHAGTFGAATDNTGDTDGSTAVITGMTDTSDFLVGDYVDVSAGFPTTGLYRVVALTATTMTLDTNSDAAVDNITVDTSDPTFKAMANLGA